MDYIELRELFSSKTKSEKNMFSWVKFIKEYLDNEIDTIGSLINTESLLQNDMSEDDLSLFSILKAYYYFYKEDDELVHQNILAMDDIGKSMDFQNSFITALDLIGTDYLRYEEYKLSNDYYLILVNRCEEKQIPFKLAYIYNNMSINYRSLGEFDEALKCVKKSIEINKTNNDNNLAYSYLNLANIYYQLNSIDKALQYLFEALKIAEEKKLDYLAAKLYNNIGNIYNDGANYKEAEIYYEKALIVEKKLNDQTSIATILLNMGIVNRRIGNETEANRYFNQSLEICKAHNIKKIRSQNLSFLGHMAYDKKEIEKAKKYFSEAAEIVNILGDTHYETKVLIDQGKFHIGIEELEAAESNLLKALNLAKENNYDSFKQEALEELTNYYKKVGNDRQLLLYQDELLKTIKENAEKDYTKRVAEMQKIFEIERKEKEAEIYRFQVIELQKKNEIIEKQKIELEKTLTELRTSEINYEYVNKQLKDNIGSIVGDSEEIKHLITLIKQVAATPSTPILITGETGTGKELVARAIHDFSDRKSKNFCAVNVSAIPETLFDSEFFGYRKNSFTGADRDKPGWFTIADKGTLFLDEIGTLDLNLQKKFLRVLENKTFIPVGSTTEIITDFRVISATNQNLTQAIKEGIFRTDLYHRLSTFTINIPPLRERVDDIPVLLEYFVKKFSDMFAKKILKVENQVVSYLRNYEFPGNVRELRNIVERAVILSNSSTLKLKCFDLPVNASSKEKIVSLEENEKQLILKALKKTGFNQAKAAILLDISAKSLERRVKKFGFTKE
ncbi:MAG: sigma 54-interacting transcriptional regulator [Candidatus Cloacimonetes bacterium]|nr:sigma 54-interacting transcriptional regulator [Candidatus Cloacimonadota bacterium]